MESPTYKLDRRGYINYQVGYSTHYLCGISVAYKDCWVYTIYWTSDCRHAISVFDLDKVWNKMTSTAIGCEGVPMGTLVGTTSSYVTHDLPYKLSVGEETVHLNTYDISTKRWAHEPLTPKWLHAATKPAPPILKPQNIYDYAFLMGTLCTMCTAPPDWRLYVPKVVRGLDLYWGAGLVDDLDRYFRRGKVFKPGVRLTDVPSPDMMRDEYRHDAHRGEHRDPKPAPRLKPQSLYGYAFKVGTLCTMGTVPPDWKPLISMLTSGHVNGAGLGDAMNEHYRAGILCKPGTQLSDLIINSGLVYGPLPTTNSKL